MKREDRLHRMYLEDMNIAMGRIAEYMHAYSFIQFKQDYKTAIIPMGDYKKIFTDFEYSQTILLDPYFLVSNLSV